MIIAGDYETEETNTIAVAEVAPIYAHKSVDTFLEKTFWKAKEEVQRAFLWQLFMQNPTFIAQFDAFIKAEVEPANTKSMAGLALAGFGTIILDCVAEGFPSKANPLGI